MKLLNSAIAAAARVRAGSGVDSNWDNVVFYANNDSIIDFSTTPVFTLHFSETSGSTSTIDTSNNRTLTANANAVISTTQSKFGTASCYIPDASSCFRTTDMTYLNGLGNFTIAGWIYKTSASDGCLISNWTPGNAGACSFICKITAANKLQFAYGIGGTNADLTASTGSITLNQWTHVEFVRSGTTMYYFIDGVASGTGTFPSSANLNSGTIAVDVGRIVNTGNSLIGYIDDLVVYKAALHTSGFTPPSSPYSETLIVRPFNDVKGHSSILTSAIENSTTQSKFGGASTYFSGSTQYTYVNNNNQDFWFNVGDFTIEFWMYASNVSGSKNLYDGRPGSTNGAYPTLYLNGNVLRYYVNTADQITGIIPIQATTWYHIAVCRYNGVTRLFVNGTQDGNSYTDTINYLNATNRPVFGISGYDLTTAPFAGYIDDVRVTKGVARYTEDFSSSIDTNWKYTTLAIKGDGANDGTVFSDLKLKPITRGGNTVTKTGEKKFGTASIYFDGTGDYLSVAYSSYQFDFQSSDFTIEAWINPQVSVNNKYILGAIQYGQSFGWAIYLEATTGLPLLAYEYPSAGNSVSVKPSIPISVSVWQHLAITRSSGVYRIFLDGNLIKADNTKTAHTISASNRPFQIGQNNGYATPDYNGYMDDIRILKGVALYTTQFAVGSDSSWNNTTLLMNMDGADNGTVFSDLASGLAITTAGNAKMVTATKKFGLSSAYFDGNGDYLSLGNTPTELQIGSVDFTVEFWVYTLSTSPHFICGNLNDTNGNGHFWVILNSTYTGLHTVQFGIQGATNKFGSSALTTSAWTHVAITRSGTDLKCFIDGTQLDTTKSQGSFTGTTASEFRIGAAQNGAFYYLNGYLDDLRITKGTARYTANFTSPTAAHPRPNFSIASSTFSEPDFPYNQYTRAHPTTGATVDPYWSNVVLGMHMDGFNNGTVFHDEKGNTITTVGDAKTVTATKKFGYSSGYFDGSGDYLTAPAGTSWDFGSQDFTIELWAYHSSLADYRSLVSKYPSITNGAWRLVSTSTGALIFGLQNSGTGVELASTAGSVTTTTWQHIAVSKTGQNLKIFVDGTAVATSTTFVSTFATLSNSLSIGRNEHVNTWFFNGYMDDIRITKGTARYTDNFTPPTKAFPRG